MSQRIRHFPPTESWLSRETASIRDVLLQMNKSPWGFIILTDSELRVCGTVTDGDIRRAFLNGASLDTSVDHAMQSKPAVGVAGNTTKNMALLEAYGFLPVVDNQGKLVEIQLLIGEVPGITTALIMAGGFGTRLGERTKTMPKPLITVGDKPMIEHVVDRLEQAGAEVIYVSVHYLADQIIDFFKNRKNNCRIEFLYEEQPMGTAGALGRLDSVIDPILVINADVVTKTDLRLIEAFHRRHAHDATIAVATCEVQVPYGVIRQDENGRFRAIDEKPTVPFFVSAGIYLLSPSFCNLVPPNLSMDMPDLIEKGHSLGLTVGLFPIHEYWLDVGRPNDLETAHRDHGGR